MSNNDQVLVGERVNVGRVGRDINHDTWEHALSECRQRYGISEVPDGAALAIAAAFQGPARAGAVFAELSTTGSVGVGELLDAISAEYADRSHDDDTRMALNMLSTWVLNHPTRRQKW